MAPPLQPEFFLLLGTDLFLAASLLTCLLDKHFPWQLPYLYQLAALVGFGQLLVSQTFQATFDSYMRFWYATLYLIVALANIIAVNAYLGFMKKLITYARVILMTVTFPSLTLAAFFMMTYANVAGHPLIIAPTVSWETSFIGIVAFDTCVVGVGTYVFFKPKWWYIAAGSGAAIIGAATYVIIKPAWGEAAFVVSAVALALACVIVLGISVFVLAKIWLDTIKQRKRRREVK